jgi:drug/metabolite transporter (DMT)-like permease
MPDRTPKKNTFWPSLIGFSAIFMWAFLALFTAASGNVPPFQLTGICFAIGGTIGLIHLIIKGKLSLLAKQPWQSWLLGVSGLFGYHFFYFFALRHAPEIEASLIAFLWPLFIVLGSTLLPNERLRVQHIIGALLGFLGAAIILTDGFEADLSHVWQSQYAIGFMAALLCAFIWSSYSLLSRRQHDVPSELVTGFCLVSAALSMVCHLAFEQTQWPITSLEWLATLALGFFPVGLAFFCWDYAVKKGNIQLLGVASYFSPLISTLVLILAGFGTFDFSILMACICIVLGAFIASIKY